MRAGASRVLVPVALREILTPALTASPTARRAVTWIDGDTRAPGAAALLIPVTAPPPALTIALVGAATPPAVAGAPVDRGAPVAAAPPSLVAELWSALAAGVPIGERLDALLTGAPHTTVKADVVASVRHAGDVKRAEDKLYAGLGSVIDSALDKQVHRRLSRHVSRLAVARGITPNQITVASLIVGLAAAAAFAGATPAAALAGLMLYLAAVVLDHADGEVARLTLTESAIGAWLDVVADTVVHASVVIALGVAAGALAGRGQLLGLVAAAGVVASASAAFRWPATGAVEDRVGTFLNDMGSRDGFYVMLLGFLAGVTLAPQFLPALMTVVAAGTHAYWVGRVVYRLSRRASEGAAKLPSD